MKKFDNYLLTHYKQFTLSLKYTEAKCEKKKLNFLYFCFYVFTDTLFYMAISQFYIPTKAEL